VAICVDQYQKASQSFADDPWPNRFLFVGELPRDGE
jgi:hypothetical protein